MRCQPQPGQIGVGRAAAVAAWHRELQMSHRQVRIRVVRLLTAALLLPSLALLLPESRAADVVRTDESRLARQLAMPLTIWSNPQVKTQGLVVAVHGLLMHGGSYDALGC